MRLKIDSAYFFFGLLFEKWKTPTLATQRKKSTSGDNVQRLFKSCLLERYVEEKKTSVMAVIGMHV